MSKKAPVIEIQGRAKESLPPPVKRPAKWWVAGMILVLAVVGYGWFRAQQASPPAMVIQTRPVETSGSGVTGAVAVTKTASTKLPVMATGLLTPAAAPAVVVKPVLSCPGAIRVKATAPDYAAANLADVSKRVREGTNAWQTVSSFPHSLLSVSPGPRRVCLEVEGFTCSFLTGTNEATVFVDPGRTNEVEFSLRPKAAMLTVACNVTNAEALIDSRHLTLDTPLFIPSLQPFALMISAPGYRKQAVKLGTMVPGSTERREVMLEREAGRLRVVASVPERAMQFLARTTKRLRLGTNDWTSVQALPHEQTNVACGPLEVELEANGFESVTQRVIVVDAKTVDVAMVLVPRSVMLTLSCNVTNADVQFADRHLKLDTPLMLPALQSLELSISAPGYAAQTVKLQAADPGTIHRLDVMLKPVRQTAVAAMEGDKLEAGRFWAWATWRNTAQAYRCFAFHFPDDSRSAAARERWEDLDYEWARQRNDEYACNRFMDRHPGSPHVGLLESSLVKPVPSSDKSVRYKVPQTVLTDKAIQVLINGLATSNVWTQAAAAAALGEVGEIRAVEPLIAALKVGSRNVKSAAASALASIGDQRAVVPLIARLEDGEPAIFTALAKLNKPKAVESCASLLKSSNKNSRFFAARALGEMADAQVVGVLIAALTDSDAWVRAAAAKALGKIRDPRATDALLRTLEDPDDGPRKDAEIALGDIGDPRGIGPLCARFEKSDIFERLIIARALIQFKRPEAVQFLLTALRKSQLSDDQDAVAVPLSKFEKRGVIKAVEAACQDGTQFYTVRGKAAEVLARIDSHEALPVLIGLLQGPEKFLRRDAVLLLEEVGDPVAVEALVFTASKDEDNFVRSTAAEALGKICDPTSVPALLALMKDPDPYVRQSAAKALGMIADLRAKDALVSGFRDGNTEPWLRGVYARALADIDMERAMDLLLDALKDPNQDLRKEVAERLGDLRGGRAVEPLLNALKDSNNYVRAAAATALAKVGDVRVAESLLTALNDENAWVYQAAANALAGMKVEDSIAMGDLMRRLSNAPPHIILSVAVALTKLGDPRGVNELARLSNNKEQEKQAVSAIEALRDPRCVEALLSNSVHRASQEWSGAATRALVEIARIHRGSPLLSLFSSRDKRIRRKAAEVLAEAFGKGLAQVGNNGEREVPQELATALDDLDAEVRVHAATALLRFLGDISVEPMAGAKSSSSAGSP